jgi:predicted TIM-barrel fold metal-dependent hydrolase
MTDAKVFDEVGYPEELKKYAGRISDVDAHEWVPPDLWVEQFGEGTRTFAEIDFYNFRGMKNRYFRDVDSDHVEEINKRSAWFSKGPYAPGAYDMHKRLELMDFCGVDKQLIFPGNLALNALFLHGNADNPSYLPMITGDRREYACEMLKAQNDWVIRGQAISQRLRPVAVLLGDTPDEIYAAAKRFVKAGVRAVWFPGSILPGGRSPAHNDLDPLWDLLANSDTVCTLHVGNEAGFFHTLGWKDAAAFEGWMIGEELSIDPWTLSSMPMAAQNFTATMVVGGVFERHPKLRLGAIETGAHWLGPLAQALDMWSLNTQTDKWKDRLPLMPSEYIRRNVRIAGFPWEPIDTYIEHHGLVECYCYASDFPHVEGGTDPMGFWSKRLAHLGDDVMEKFFVTNGQWIMPD